MTALQDHRFTTERLLVDEWHSCTNDDWPRQDLSISVRDILTEPVTRHLPPSWQGLYTVARARRWIAERDDEGVTLLVVDRGNGQAVGLVVLFEIENSGRLRLGYLLRESAWGKGLASELVSGFVAWCRDHDIRSITGGVERDNVASARVLQKCGFVEERAAGEDGERLFWTRSG